MRTGCPSCNKTNVTEKKFSFYSLVQHTQLFVKNVVSSKHLTKKVEEALTLRSEYPIISGAKYIPEANKFRTKAIPWTQVEIDCVLN